MSDRLAAHGERSGFHCDQAGGRKGRSAEECVTDMVDRVDRAMERGLKVTIMASDIAQGFPSVPTKGLLRELRGQGVEEEVVRWVESIMTGRKGKMRFDGEEGEWREVENGIPQGSPVSPVLFNLYISSWLRRMERVADEEGMRVYFATFIDDVTIVLAAETWQEGRR